ncbi:alpha/beta hydrolase [Dyadobacter sp. CY312]|uniref:alpha/beta hydrolase n=1 Tax=Dyadobacter sp. CY312 TaxID=2907303 RepID=UPI001F3DAC9F|nr:alpha/beta hydrolase [Dyadobacter sp. CY312]MCE7041667.1 alpha/beta hydrolase [Dyadobacter sp. CY312]
MMEQLVKFFHGGGSEEDFEADEKLVSSLKKELGADYVLQYPFLPNDGSPDLGRRRQISSEIAAGDDGVILVGHSFGASMLLVCLSESDVRKHIGGVFLLATPFWKGEEDWVQPFKLNADFAEKIDKNIPLFFYHCRDDEEVPFEQQSVYRKHLPWASFHEVPAGGHQFNNDLRKVAEDIKSLGERGLL